MARPQRLIIVGVPYHLTQQGNHRQDVFLTDDDRRQYLAWLRDYAQRYGLAIWAYCLMTNHVHLVAVPTTELALARTVQMTHMRYTQRINQRQQWSGHLWQGRFYACALDEAHCWTALRYVEQNPVRAGLVTAAADYRWSSAAAHCGVLNDPVLTPIPSHAVLPDWAAWLAAEDADESARLRQHTQRGYPVGSPDFLASLATRLGHAVQPRPRGRPKKDAGGNNGL